MAAPELTISIYGKCHAVYGPGTKKHKEALKKLGMSWNPSLDGGKLKAWIIPTSREDTLKALIDFVRSVNGSDPVIKEYVPDLMSAIKPTSVILAIPHIGDPLPDGQIVTEIVYGDPTFVKSTSGKDYYPGWF